MQNIKEYFNNFYANTHNTEEWEKIDDYEYYVYTMKDDEFEAWAADLNIDLTAINPNTGITYLQHWLWDFDE